MPDCIPAAQTLLWGNCDVQPLGAIALPGGGFVAGRTHPRIDLTSTTSATYPSAFRART